MNFPWFKSTFLRVLKFLQTKERGPDLWGEPILQKVWIIWWEILYMNFKSFVDPNSSSLIRVQCMLHDSGVLLSDFFNFNKLKSGRNFWGTPILNKVWIVWSRLLYFNFKSFEYPRFSFFIRFECIMHDSGVPFSEASNFHKIKRGDLISAGNKFCKKSELFDGTFCISILKTWWTQILRHSIYFNALCMIQEYLSQSLQISAT